MSIEQTIQTKLKPVPAKTPGYPVKSLKKEKGKLMRFLTILGRSRLLPPDFEVEENKS